MGSLVECDGKWNPQASMFFPNLCLVLLQSPGAPGLMEGRGASVLT